MLQSVSHVGATGSIATEFGTAGILINEPGYYVLDNDLSASGRDYGVLILADHVTFDLNGHTISDPSGESTIVGIIAGPAVSVRNGTLVGGSQGVVARAGSFASTIELKHLTIQGLSENPGYTAVKIEQIYEVRITFVNISKANFGIRAEYSIALISNNHVEARQIGIEAISGFPSGEIRGNFIQASQALIVLYATLVEGNRIFCTGAAGSACVRILAGENVVRRNRITVDGAGNALSVGVGNVIEENDFSGSYEVAVDLPRPHNRVERNRISGARESGILVSSIGNRISENVITSVPTGVRVEGELNLIEDNRIRTSANGCGIEFTASSGNVHRGNSVAGGAADVCGPVNTNGGSSVGDAPARERRRASPLRRPWRNDLAPTCGSDHISLVTTLQSTETSHGPAGLVIDRPGHYLVTRDLVVPEGVRNGILVLASGVVLDFDKHIMTPGPSQVAYMIRVVGSGDVTLKDGFLSGGAYGIVAQAPPEILARLSIEGMQLYSEDLALWADNVDQLEITNSLMDGDDFAARIFGSSSGRILRSRFSGAESALEASGFHHGEVFRNRFCCGSVGLGSDNLLEENYFYYADDFFALSVADRNHILGNYFGTSPDSSLSLLGRDNVVERNIILSGRTGISSMAGGNLILRNYMFAGGGVGVEAQGTDNSIVDNLLVASKCGIVFEEPANSYRENVVLFSDEGLCGTPAQNAGDNVLPPPSCGNDVRSVQELCDGQDIGGASCWSEGYEGGTLACNVSCDGYKHSGCWPAVCGNGVDEYGESCDGGDLGGFTCQTLLFDEGTLACKEPCLFDTSGCRVICGNGNQLWPEICDGNDLGGATCQSQGFSGGTLACSSTCDAFDTSGCW